MIQKIKNFFTKIIAFFTINPEEILKRGRKWHFRFLTDAILSPLIIIILIEYSKFPIQIFHYLGKLKINGDTLWPLLEALGQISLEAILIWFVFFAMVSIQVGIDQKNEKGFGVNVGGDVMYYY